MTTSLSLSLRIQGTQTAKGKARKISDRSLQAIQSKAKVRAEQTVRRFQTEMAREYTSQWATGQLARGITYKTAISDNGVDVQFYIQERRELRFVTALLGGHFRQFPVGPFLITPTEGKALVIRLPPGRARRFIRGRGGQFQGSKEGPIVVRQTLWGKKTGGFSRDVIAEVAAEEGVLFVRDMEEAVKNVIVQVTSGG